METVPLGLIVFVVGQTGTAVWAIIKLYFSNEAMKLKIKEIEDDNRQLKTDLRKLSDTLLLVQHSVDLLVIGKLKTGNNK